MIKIGMNVELCNVLLSFHVYIEKNVMDSRHLSLGVEQGVQTFMENGHIIYYRLVGVPKL
jgi:hypothetical protein